MARGKAVRDLSSGYRSDFDLLIVVSHPELAEDHWWYGAEDGLNFEESLGATRYPYNIVVHDIADVKTARLRLIASAAPVCFHSLRRSKINVVAASSAVT